MKLEKSKLIDKILRFAAPVIFWAGFALFIAAAYKTIQMVW